MLQLTDQNFQKEVLESNIPVLVDFSASWCGPCQMMAPVLEELAKEFENKIKFGQLDVDKNSPTAAKYGVMSIPTIIFFRQGAEVKREVGFVGKENLVNLIKEIFNF